MEITEQEVVELMRQRDELVALFGRAHDYMLTVRLMNVAIYIQIPEESPLARDCQAMGRHIGEAAAWLEQIHNEAKRRYQQASAEESPSASEPVPEAPRVIH